MEKVINIYKPQGMTPLQAIDAVRRQYPECQDEKMTYAGRLDPMAEGVLIVLVGDAVYRKEEYLKFDKVYEADIVFGLGTDTHDLLGIATMYDKVSIEDVKMKEEVKKMKGDFEYPFPIYSSKPVNGKPLFQWAREGRLEEIEIPSRLMKVYEVELLNQYSISAGEIKGSIERCIMNVRGDFRQEEILNRWGMILEGMGKEVTFSSIRIRIHCASGTYVRILTYELGKRLGTDAVLTKLVRTKVGSFESSTSTRIV